MSPQSTDPDMYRLTYRIPDNCDPASCDYFLGINVNAGNSSYLDIYLSGDTDGWIAIGFSSTSSMVCGGEGRKEGPLVIIHTHSKMLTCWAAV